MERFKLKVGDSAVLKYSFRLKAPLIQLEARAEAKRVGEPDVSLKFTRALLRVRTAEPSDAPGLTMRERGIRHTTIN